MKKVISFVTSAVIATTSLSANTEAKYIDYEQPFDSGTYGSETYRIPALLTLKNGSVIASADIRYSHGSDSPENLENLVAVSDNGLNDWKYNRINYFDDCADGYSDKTSASFIDSAIIQSESTDRIFIVADAFPSGIGCLQAEKGTGFNDDGKLILTENFGSRKKRDYNYTVGEFEDGYATIYDENGVTNYSIDREYNLYRDGKPIYAKQKGSDKQIQQNVFYEQAELHIFPTSYLWLRYSDDNGMTWSEPIILNSQVKDKSDGFLGICPGRGAVTTVDGKERIVFIVYDHTLVTEHARTIYSDDNGLTWKAGEPLKFRLGLGKISESQIVTTPDGNLRMFSRNSSDFIGTSVSTDGGITWTRAAAVNELEANASCMVSAINYSRQINGKSTVLVSYPSVPGSRIDGIIRVGLIDDNGILEWISTYHVNDGFFAYSCLTELADGTIAYLYEDEAAHISYKLLTVDENGNLNDINGNNCVYEKEIKINKFIIFLRKIGFWLNIL